MADIAGEGTFETRKDAGQGGAGAVRLWLSALKLAGKDEKDYHERAEAAIKRYRDEQKENRKVGFNILYSSVQTQGPAIYNSTPEPDVRRRFNDEDPVGKIAAQIFERALSHCMDEYDFDNAMESVVHDSLLPGRGTAIVVYDPKVDGDSVSYEGVRLEHVQWDDFRHGPGKKWEDVPWIAIRYRITRNAAKNLNPKIGATINLDHIEKDADADEKDPSDIFKRLTVWKIWDKARREIVFIAPSYKEDVFAKQEDILGLKDFFPMPRPMQDILDSSSLIPLVPFEMYKDQAEELDRITRRIGRLINCLRWRGIRPAQLEEFDLLKDAEDGDLVPSQSFDTALMTQGATADKAIWLMPIDRLIEVIRELVVQREQIKQVVFEISGLADIMRGETNPNETLGAQQIKAQWGSLRMQRRQREAQRFVRDVLRIKAEIIGEHFSTDTLEMISGIHLPSAEEKQQAEAALQQAQMMGQQPPEQLMNMASMPSWDEVKALMSSDALRSFRVDIETDSTIQADQTRAQQNISQFIEGLAAFGQAVGPAVQAGIMPTDIVADLLSGFARNFKLGKQASDAIDRLGKQPPQPQKPDPEMEKAKLQQAEQAQKQQEQAHKQQMETEESARKTAQQQADMKLAETKTQNDYQAKLYQISRDAELKQAAAEFEQSLKQRQQDMSEEGAKNEFIASQGGALIPALQDIMMMVQKIGAAADSALEEVQALKEEAAAPVEIQRIVENGKTVGAIRRQNGKETRISIQ